MPTGETSHLRSAARWAAIASAGKKSCSICKEEKLLSEFWERKGREGQWHSWCKLCAASERQARDAANPEKIAEQKHRWLLNNKDVVYTKHARYRKNIRDQVFDHYGNSCVCCGETSREFLAIDHTKGGGSKHRKEIKRTGVAFYRWLIQNGLPEGYRTLCHCCNQSHGMYGYCPHELAYENVDALVGAC